MREFPPLIHAPKYPSTSIVALAAIGATIAWWSGVDISPWIENFQWPTQPWRLVTSALFHVNFLHLLFNLYWLWIFGVQIESYFGTLKTALMYLLFAASSGAAEYAIFDGGVGLSGVVYGQFALLYVLGKHHASFADSIDPKVVRDFVGWFFLCIVTTVTKMMPVANVAHAVGALAGCLLGYAIVNSGKSRNLMSAALATTCALTFALASIAREFVNLGDKSRELVDRGHDAWKRKDYEASADYYERAWKADPTNQPVRHAAAEMKSYVGQVALSESKWQKAAELFESALRIEDTSAENWYRLAYAHHSAGNDAAATAALQKAIERSPDPKFKLLLDELRKAEPPKK